MTFVLTTELERSANRALPAQLSEAVTSILEHLREGCLQRSLCLIVSVTSVASGLEVGYEHYKGSYSNPVMYTPVILSGALAGAGFYFGTPYTISRAAGACAFYVLVDDRSGDVVGRFNLNDLRDAA